MDEYQCELSVCDGADMTFEMAQDDAKESLTSATCTSTPPGYHSAFSRSMSEKQAM